jgi:serine/threonine protein phosphatase PrpC
MMRPEIDFAGREILGARDNQEDFYAFEQLEGGGLLLALADGVGGAIGGELASHAAVHGFLDSFAASRAPDGLRFQTSLARANQAVARAIEAAPIANIHMATTLLAVQVKPASLQWISVGDCPLILFRDGKLIRLNQDHSGKAEHHEPGLARNALASALTGGRIRLIDRHTDLYPLEAGDLVLAASDGIWTLSREEITSCLADQAAEEASQISTELLAQVLGKGKATQDNATAAIIKIVSGI